MAGGILDMVEGAYDTTVDGDRWLLRANEHFAKRFAGVMAWGGHIMSKSEAGLPVFHNAVLDGVDDAMSVFGAMHSNMSPEFAEAVFPTGTKCGLFTEHWHAIEHTRPWGEDAFETVRTLHRYFASFGGNDLLFTYGYDRAGSGVLLGAVVNNLKLHPATREIHRLAAVHLTAGLRLRRSLETKVGEPAEAIFEADGRLAHAEGLASTQDMRARLREAVTKIDHARTDAIRRKEMDALTLWQGLVQGRWSVIDRHDTDGRRYYVAISNPPEGVSARRLSEVEAQIVAQVVAGEPNGVIAYSLGLAESTVAGHLTNAMRKLGAGSRMDVVRLGRGLGAREIAPASEHES